LPTPGITWFQAEQACALSNKRLLTNQEWQRAAAGTRDPGANDGLANTMCNTDGAGPRATGLAGSFPGHVTTCVSQWGAEDMVGNVAEWVGDWSDRATDCTDWTTSAGIAGGDFSCLRGDGATEWHRIPGALIRDGTWYHGASSGVFAVTAFFSPSVEFAEVGFRCAR
jgi:formylglycine-generating enzyme required for sulfatase activity